MLYIDPVSFLLGAGITSLIIWVIINAGKGSGGGRNLYA